MHVLITIGIIIGVGAGIFVLLCIISFLLDNEPTFRSLGRDFFEYQELLANQWFYTRDACFTGAIG